MTVYLNQETSQSVSSIPCTDSVSQQQSREVPPTPPQNAEGGIDFFALLTESQINLIKFMIAEKFNEILKKAKVKRILRLQSYVRSREDH